MITAFASGNLKVNKKIVLLMALLICLTIVIFPISSFLRLYAGGDYQNINYNEYINLVLDYYINSDYDFTHLIPVFERAGFFDFTVDSIKNADIYASVINLPWELMSIIDGITPSFDIFNKPLISNAVVGIYYETPELLIRNHNEGYHSDQFNFYGEFFILFGPIISLPMILIVGLLFKNFYINFMNKLNFNFFVWRSVILYLFILFINSFGLDWIIVNSLPMIIFIVIMLSLIIKKQRTY
jgi:hypothetical protein